MTTAMTCTECLRLVSTAGVGELTTATAVTDHCQACPDCARVVDEVAEETRRFADLLDGTAPGIDAHVVALRAVAASARARRRRTTGWWLVGGVCAVAIPLASMIVVRGPGSTVPAAQRDVLLRCLTGTQAIELARDAMSPELRTWIRMSVRPADALPVVHVAGPPNAVEIAERVLAAVDAEYGPRFAPSCPVAPGVPVPPAPPAPRP
jgi:hypothetical protein